MTFFFLFLLLIYYWYFYAFNDKPIKKPSTELLSQQPPVYKFRFESDSPNHFRFVVNENNSWEHTLPEDNYTFHQSKIVQIDPCHNKIDDAFVLAKGRVLYNHLKNNPNSVIMNNFSPNFNQDGQFTLTSGNVFYFKCLKGRIKSLQICPSGSTFVTDICKPVNSCTNKPNGVLLPHSHQASQYIVCENGNETIFKCPPEKIFHHDRCEHIRNLNHYCERFPNVPFMYDERTRVECRNKRLHFITCKPGYEFLGKDYCEPSNCVGLPNGSKLKLANRRYDPFYFSPGYMTCFNEKIYQTVECPQSWDNLYSKGDNLTFLPMVFDGQKCSIPAFGENVFSEDPDVIVPVHEFTKHVKNWKLSQMFDSLSGYVYENNVRKRKYLDPGQCISKRFKADESACTPEITKIPILNNPNSFYDCESKSIVHCYKDKIFNGTKCVDTVKHYFNYNDFPLFYFNNLNQDSGWIPPFDYSKEAPISSCQDDKDELIKLYNICSHPDCSKYAFVSQLPNFAILLPEEQHGAKCKFYENEKRLKKEPVNFNYHFWTQRIIDENVTGEHCIMGQKLKTGNFIWDSTIFATCNLNQPFVFCPSPHTKHIIMVDNKYFACGFPEAKDFTTGPANGIPFAVNEIKRIKPVADRKWRTIRLNKSSNSQYLPDEGLEMPIGAKLNLITGERVKLEPRYRVNYPPNVAIKYDDLQEPKILSSTMDSGFLVKLQNFTQKSISLYKHEPINMVESFEKDLLYISEKSSNG